MDTKIKSRSRGRPRAFDRDAALDQAQAMFHAHGYEGVGVAALAEAMGVNPPSLYGAFGSKIGLYEEVLRRYSDASPLTDPLDRSGVDTAAALSDLLVRAAIVYSADPKAPGCMALEGERSTDSDAACLARGCRDQNVRLLRDFIGSTHPEKADVVADYVAAVMSGLSADARGGHSTERLIAVADMAGLAIGTMLSR